LDLLKYSVALYHDGIIPSDVNKVLPFKFDKDTFLSKKLGTIAYL